MIVVAVVVADDVADEVVVCCGVILVPTLVFVISRPRGRSTITIVATAFTAIAFAVWWWNNPQCGQERRRLLEIITPTFLEVI